MAVDSQRRALLLHVTGLDGQEIYYTLMGNEENKDYEATIKVLDDSFISKNVSFENRFSHKLYRRAMKPLTNLCAGSSSKRPVVSLARKNEDDYIRDQLIDKCFSNQLRRKFQENGGLVKLNDLLVIARAQEAVDRQLRALGSNMNIN